jgi:putative FmdB family regulatory protein
MARYVYACTACGQRFEVEKPMAASADPSVCPSCQAPGRRVFTAPGIAVKGSPVKFSGNSDPGCGGCANGACPWN